MTPSCAGCGAALSHADARRCGVCGLKVGDLPSNVDHLRAQEAPRGLRRSSAVHLLRPMLLGLVLLVMVGFALGAGAAAGQTDNQPMIAAAGRTAVTMLEAAEGAIARRSRTPGPGNPDSQQWKQAGAAQLAVLAV